MENPVELIAETKQAWAAPELKKVDVEQITAADLTLSNPDGLGNS